MYDNLQASPERDDTLENLKNECNLYMNRIDSNDDEYENGNELYQDRGSQEYMERKNKRYNISANDTSEGGPNEAMRNNSILKGTYIDDLNQNPPRRYNDMKLKRNPIGEPSSRLSSTATYVEQQPAFQPSLSSKTSSRTSSKPTTSHSPYSYSHGSNNNSINNNSNQYDINTILKELEKFKSNLYSQQLEIENLKRDFNMEKNKNYSLQTELEINKSNNIKLSTKNSKLELKINTLERSINEMRNNFYLQPSLIQSPNLSPIRAVRNINSTGTTYSNPNGIPSSSSTSTRNGLLYNRREESEHPYNYYYNNDNNTSSNYQPPTRWKSNMRNIQPDIDTDPIPPSRNNYHHNDHKLPYNTRSLDRRNNTKNAVRMNAINEDSTEALMAKVPTRL
ncbi:uncharacterized protein NDAI_0E02150 [Naumovozyma dairenensis CBS 421]|uniref:Uncharacterized protein n=1 Tax=Naumovozyma dairenensis (strain ATCC 10597 / BCRC 20456 / CBS 421 / NBRC 0211 / NRRL Y-12639) TaxID=1071378 RepID=G0WBB2_NAUDC|nr:hypothetical protein NDAI_0E02150 [Naumovozyma dairenensis CBS 421]CCD25032.1 hypothetical protein NDAI_0E02150 [Naumovozyma dairenensis CBS 421]